MRLNSHVTVNTCKKYRNIGITACRKCEEEFKPDDVIMSRRTENSIFRYSTTYAVLLHIIDKVPEGAFDVDLVVAGESNNGVKRVVYRYHDLQMKLQDSCRKCGRKFHDADDVPTPNHWRLDSVSHPASLIMRVSQPLHGQTFRPGPLRSVPSLHSVG